MADFSEWSPEASATTSSPPVEPPPETDLPTFADRTHTVSASATGGGTGTDASPWTLTEACQYAQPGMIIGVRTGVYVGLDPAPGYPLHDGNPETNTPGDRKVKGGFTLYTSGTASQRIYLIAENFASLETDTNRMCWIRSGATVLACGWAGMSIRGSYITVAGFYFSDVGQSNDMAGNDSGRLLVWGDFRHVEIRYCRFFKDPKHYIYQISNWNRKGNNDGSVRIEAGDGPVLIADNFFEGDWDSNHNNSPHILYYQSSNIIVEHNEFHRGNCSVFLKRGFLQPSGQFSRPLITRIRYNLSRGVSKALYICGIRDEDPGGDNEDVRNWFYCNVFKDTKADIISIGSDNAAAACHNAMRIFNNVFYGTTDPAYAVFDTETLGGLGFRANPWSPWPRDNMVFNNITLPGRVYGSRRYSSGEDQPIDAQFWHDFWQFERNILQSANQIWKAEGHEPLNSATLTDMQAVGGELNSLFGVDPLLDSEHKPLPGSPAIGLGRDRLGAFGPVDGVVNAGCYPTGTEVIGIRR